MKSMIKNIVTVTIGLFVGGTLINLYGLLFSVPNELLAALGVDADVDNLDKVKGVLDGHVYFTGIEFVLAVGIITFLFLNRNKAEQEEVVYVEKYINEDDTSKEAVKGETQLEKGERRSMLKEQVKQMIKPSDLPTEEVMGKILTLLCEELEASIAVVYGADYRGETRKLRWIASYAYYLPESETRSYEFGEGLAGQVARSEKKMYLEQVPAEALRIKSGLGESKPAKLLLLPLHHQEKLAGVLELGTFKFFSDEEQAFIEEFIALSTPYLAQHMENAQPSTDN